MMELIVFSMFIGIGIGWLILYWMRIKNGKKQVEVYDLKSKKNIPSSAVIPSPSLHSNEFNHMSNVQELGGLIPFIHENHLHLGPIFEFYLPSSTGKENIRYISIDDPLTLKKTFKFGDRPKDLFEFLTPLVGKDNLQIYSGERALKFRKVVSSAFGIDAMKQSFQPILKLCDELVENWKQTFTPTKEFLAQDELLKFAFEAFMRSAFRMEHVDLNFEEMKAAYDMCMGYAFDRQFGLKSEEKEIEFEMKLDFIHKELRHLSRKVQNQARKKEQSENDLKKGFCELLMTSIDPDTGKLYAEEKVIEMVSLYIIAAYHTTSTSLAWILHGLAIHPEVQSKVNKEIQEQLGDNKRITWDALDNFSYLNQVIDESLRFFVTAPFGAREINESMELLGYFIPAKTAIFYPFKEILWNNEIWTNPEVFDPNRFHKNNLTSLQKRGFCPFGMGARICPGEQLARLEMRLFLITFLREFKVTLPKDISTKPPVVERLVVMASNGLPLHLSLN